MYTNKVRTAPEISRAENSKVGFIFGEGGAKFLMRLTKFWGFELDSFFINTVISL